MPEPRSNSMSFAPIEDVLRGRDESCPLASHPERLGSIAAHGENERRIAERANRDAAQMLAAAGFENITSNGPLRPPGHSVHEMGTARMGKDPKTSVVNAFNQMHEVPNVFITDGSFMTSSSCVNPSLTYMAMTARACHYAATEMKKLNL